MIDEVGADKVNDLRRISLTPIKIDRQSYIELIEYFGRRVAEMKQENGE